MNALILNYVCKFILNNYLHQILALKRVATEGIHPVALMDLNKVHPAPSWMSFSCFSHISH